MLKKSLFFALISISLVISLAFVSAASAQCTDNDGDGFGNPASAACTYNLKDCDDSDPMVYPYAPHYRTLCDGKDTNCDGLVDFPTDKDADGDGYKVCDIPKDCNDANAAINPGVSETPPGGALCTDGIDNDCDWLIDIQELSCQNPCYDRDGDGYFDINSDPSCTSPRDDCNDSNANINPAASDSNCNNVDENCSGTPDDQYVAPVTNCGIGICAAAGFAQCVNGAVVDDCVPGTPQLEDVRDPADPVCTDGLDNDCDGDTDYPADFGCHPCQPTGLPDTNCDGIDDDCNGAADDLYAVTPTSCGVGACAAAGQLECQGGVEVDTCTAGTPVLEEGQPTDPVCKDTIDNDCDGVVDECSFCNDQDGDGFGDPANALCTYNLKDCDDSDPMVYPYAPHYRTLCDGKDTNCDGRVDFSTDKDADGDGYKVCDIPKDCNDNNPNAYPGHLEGPPGDPTCFDGVDNDCDVLVDGNDSNNIPNCVSWEGNCSTRTDPKNGPHMFALLDPANDTVIKQPCTWCHFDGTGTIDQRRYCQRCHSDPADTSDPLNGILKDPLNPSAYPLDPAYGFGTAPNVSTHLFDAVSPATAPDCITCHNPHLQEQDALYGTTYGNLIKEFICYGETAMGNRFEERIEFTAPAGPGSFADGPPHNENICEMCHTQTLYHRNDGTTLPHNDGDKCSDCHAHGEGFKASCGSCHVSPPPTGSHLKHFGGDPVYAAYGNTGITGDYVSQGTEYIINCGNCHPIGSTSHRNGVLNPGGGSAEIELYNPAAPSGSLKAMNPASASYTPGGTVLTDAQGFTYTEGTCDNIYCHSVTGVTTSGPVSDPAPFVYPLEYNPPWQSLVVTSRTYQSTLPWGMDTDADGMCNNCHGNPITTEFPTVSAGAGDSHQWIDDYGYGNIHAWNMGYAPLQCNTCHYSTVHAVSTWTRDLSDVTTYDDVPIFNTASHVNGIKDVAFTPLPVIYPTSGGDVSYDLSTVSFDPSTKTCDNVGCHQFQTSVEWGNPYRWWNSTECNVCHRF